MSGAPAGMMPMCPAPAAAAARKSLYFSQRKFDATGRAIRIDGLTCACALPAEHVLHGIMSCVRDTPRHRGLEPSALACAPRRAEPVPCARGLDLWVSCRHSNSCVL